LCEKRSDEGGAVGMEDVVVVVVVVVIVVG
jgi:hypothetical protein